jgi:hypothetical protein
MFLYFYLAITLLPLHRLPPNPKLTSERGKHLTNDDESAWPKE